MKLRTNKNKGENGRVDPFTVAVEDIKPRQLCWRGNGSLRL